MHLGIALTSGSSGGRLTAMKAGAIRTCLDGQFAGRQVPWN